MGWRRGSRAARSPDARIDGCEEGAGCFQYRLYYMHALSHPIGLDVHDNEQLLAKIAAAVRKYANIGVRIEDDYIVTAAGFDRITSGAPREMDEIEREMAVRAPLTGRDSALVEAHKRIRP